MRIQAGIIHKFIGQRALAPLRSLAGLTPLADTIGPIPFSNLWDDYSAVDADWVGWWDNILPNLTADDIETVWSVFDRLRFYSVVPFR